MRDVRSLGSHACGQDPDWKMEGDEVVRLLATVGSPSGGGRERRGGGGSREFH